MTAIDLAHSAASDASPPAGLTDTARALWFAKAGRWDAAHDLCQDIPGTAGSWIHAYPAMSSAEVDDGNRLIPDRIVVDRIVADFEAGNLVKADWFVADLLVPDRLIADRLKVDFEAR